MIESFSPFNFLISIFLFPWLHISPHLRGSPCSFLNHYIVSGILRKPEQAWLIIAKYHHTIISAESETFFQPCSVLSSEDLKEQLKQLPFPFLLCALMHYSLRKEQLKQLLASLGSPLFERNSQSTQECLSIVLESTTT